MSALRDVSQILWCCNVTERTRPWSSCCCPDTLKSPRMETVYSLLDLVLYSGSSVVCCLLVSSPVSWRHANTRCEINQIETQTWLGWRSVTLVSSLPKLGNESRLYKIVVLKHRLVDILIYSTVEYTIKYMYKLIAFKSEFCILNLVIFKSGQNPRKWPKRCWIVIP